MEKLGKHKHLLTNILKVAIFSLVMLAPLLAVGSKCLYVACNKNAYQSYSAEYVEKYTIVTGNNQYIVNNQYQIIYNESNTTQSSANLPVAETDAYKFLPETETRIINSIVIVAENYPRINIGFTNGEGTRIDNWQNQYKSFYFTLRTTTNLASGNFRYADIYLTTYTTEKLDNAFYYAFNQIAEEPLFNWTIETGTYTAINAMMTGLGLSNNHPITICLCYWFIIMMIYIVVDIIVVCFTKLTHFYSDGE